MAGDKFRALRGEDEEMAGRNRAISPILHELGLSAFHNGNIKAALNFMSWACADPQAPAIWHRNHSEMLMRSGKAAAAEAECRLAVGCDPNCACAWETLGTILIERGALEEGCECYETAVRIEPTFSAALNNLAVILDHLGQYEAAEARYRQSLNVVPESPNIQLNLATLLWELGRHWEGREIVRQVRVRHPNLLRAYSLQIEFSGNSRLRGSPRKREQRALVIIPGDSEQVGT
jgi:Flp pilus assembly protein TadD